MGAGVEAADLAALTEWSIMVPMATPSIRVPRIIEKKKESSPSHGINYPFCGNDHDHTLTKV